MDQKKIHDNDELQAVIDLLIEALKNATPGDDDYAKMVSQLSGLYKIKETHTTIETSKLDALSKDAQCKAETKLKNAEARIKEREANSKIPVKPETLALIGGNLAGIIAILSYEKANIITSKALGFVKTLK